MPIRTTRTQVTFHAPFRLKEFGKDQAAGTYDIDTDEEVIEGNDRTVFVRVATMIHLRTQSSSLTVTIAPDSLQNALEKDRGTVIGEWRCRPRAK